MHFHTSLDCIEHIIGSEWAKFQFHPTSRYVHRVNYDRIEEPVAGQRADAMLDVRLFVCVSFKFQ